MANRYKLVRDLAALLVDAPGAVESFSPGHWELMLDLERRAADIVHQRDVKSASSFLSDVVYLKRPHTTDRSLVKQAVLAHPAEVMRALDALARVGEVGYSAMDILAKVPFFGRGGGRSFNSAVVRLVCPSSFGILDWRNIAVLCGSPGFDGLVEPTVSFPQFSREDVLLLRGYLPFTMSVYREYNDILRSLATDHGIRTADIDLVLWTYSIQRQPFKQFSLPVLSSTLHWGPDDRKVLLDDRQATASRLVRNYLSRLADAGVLSKNQILSELRSIFALIRDECAAFGSRKKGKLKEKVRLITTALDQAIASEDPERLLGQWNRWQRMVDPASAQWIGISLPTDMVLEGHLVLEDFIPVKEYIETYYDLLSLDPRYPYD